MGRFAPHERHATATAAQRGRRLSSAIQPDRAGDDQGTKAEKASAYLHPARRTNQNTHLDFMKGFSFFVRGSWFECVDL